MTTQREIAESVAREHGETFARRAGIRLRDTPAPLYQLVVLTNLLSARIKADIAVAAARELFRAGYRTPSAMAEATWQHRVDALGRGGYRRYDERTATMLGDGARLIGERWKGDLRRLWNEADGDAVRVARLLREVPGIGPTGADIFCREVQGVWPSVAPYVDERTRQGARRLRLPTDAARLAGLVPARDFPALVSGCVRATLSAKVTPRSHREA